MSSSDEVVFLNKNILLRTISDLEEVVRKTIELKSKDRSTKEDSIVLNQKLKDILWFRKIVETYPNVSYKID